MKQLPPSSVRNKGSNNLINNSSSVLESYCTTDDSFLDEGSVSVDEKQSSADNHEMDNTEKGQGCLNKIDSKKKPLFIKVSIDTMLNN